MNLESSDYGLNKDAINFGNEDKLSPFRFLRQRSHFTSTVFVKESALSGKRTCGSPRTTTNNYTATYNNYETTWDVWCLLSSAPISSWGALHRDRWRFDSSVRPPRPPRHAANLSWKAVRFLL